MKDQKIHFIVIGRNCERMLTACFDSLCEQDSPNWHCIYIDDASTDSSLKIASTYNKKWAGHFTVQANKKRRYKGVNFLNACDSVPANGIIAELDADDRLIDKRIVTKLLRLHKLFDLIWTQHKTVNNTKRTWDTWKSTKLPQGWTRHYTRKEEDVWTKKFFPGHMRTFKKFLLNYLDDSVLHYGGEPAKAAFDMVYYTNLLEITPSDAQCFYNQPAYEYNIWPHNEDFVEIDLVSEGKKQDHLDLSQVEMNRWLKKFPAQKKINYKRIINKRGYQPFPISIHLTEERATHKSLNWEIDKGEFKHILNLLKDCYHHSEQITKLNKIKKNYS